MKNSKGYSEQNLAGLSTISEVEKRGTIHAIEPLSNENYCITFTDGSQAEVTTDTASWFMHLEAQKSC